MLGTILIKAVWLTLANIAKTLAGKLTSANSLSPLLLRLSVSLRIQRQLFVAITEKPLIVGIKYRFDAAILAVLRIDVPLLGSHGVSHWHYSDGALNFILAFLFSLHGSLKLHLNLVNAFKVLLAHARLFGNPDLLLFGVLFFL